MRTKIRNKDQYQYHYLIDNWNKDYEYQKVLRIAAENGHTEIVKLLLEHGANTNGQENHGLFNEQKNYGNPLLLATENSHTEIAKLLLEYGANANARDKSGRTVLMIAARHSQSAKQMGNIALKDEFDNLIKLLLVFGANPLTKNNGKTVLDQNNNEIIRKFMNQQILPILNGEEFTPITENSA